MEEKLYPYYFRNLFGLIVIQTLLLGQYATHAVLRQFLELGNLFREQFQQTP